MTDIKHPDVTVKLVGEDGNVFAIVGRVSLALRHAGYPDEAKDFVAAATACHSYDEVLGLCLATVDVE
jgi:hypothetical protein